MKIKKPAKPPSKGDGGTLKFLAPGRADPNKLEGAPLQVVLVKKKVLHVRLMKTCRNFRKGLIFVIPHTEFKRS